MNAKFPDKEVVLTVLVLCVGCCETLISQLCAEPVPPSVSSSDQTEILQQREDVFRRVQEQARAARGVLQPFHGALKWRTSNMSQEACLDWSKADATTDQNHRGSRLLIWSEGDQLYQWRSDMRPRDLPPPSMTIERDNGMRTMSNGIAGHSFTIFYVDAGIEKYIEWVFTDDGFYVDGSPSPNSRNEKNRHKVQMPYTWCARFSGN